MVMYLRHPVATSLRCEAAGDCHPRACPPARRHPKCMIATPHAAAIWIATPLTTGTANRAPPDVIDMTVLETALVLRAARIGTTASCAGNRPDATSDATEAAAACASANPAMATPSVKPAWPKRSCSTN